MRFNSEDNNYMLFALQLSTQGDGRTWPNPSVGCVIVSPRDQNQKSHDIIVGTGFTGKNGIPHAEIAALSEAKDMASGSTLYVTLEPCCHYGKTSPCTKEIIKKGISRVVVAMVDPNPLVSGNGIRELKNKGIKVSIGCCEKEAISQNSGFVSRITKKKPKVSIKLAITNDNFISSSENKRLKITSKKADEYIHALRAKYDGIMIGSGTLENDDPRLNVRLRGYFDYSPVKFILSRRCEININSNLFKGRNDRPLYLITGKKVDETKLNKLRENNINILKVEDDPETGLLCLNDTLIKIGDIGINNLLIEPGAILLKHLMERNIPDDIYIFKSTHKIADSGVFIPEIHNLLEDQKTNYDLSYKREVFDCDLMYYKRDLRS
jgi:diaminohydroxyphosphoribosylaminopyrimidine deaminase/5-amino-6-(5-phosphoribosylamino)uracil reductase|tara:strand:- start:169 stop:1308 length:1140 start_codon:yes stop_codon:yes gene_type:complete